MTGKDVVLVYATAPDATTAAAICRPLVEAREVACANILPGMTSLYRWEGAVETASEVVVILKTTRARVEDVVQSFADAHPYDTPAAVVLDAAGGLPAFLAWIASETALQ